MLRMGHLGLAVVGLACCWALVRAAKLGAVYTEGGFVEGVNKKLSFLGNDSVDIFKGIPFATAKTLENPQRHPGWQGTLKATDFKETCLQITLNPDSTYGDEDCLYLNIWVPQGSKQVSQDSPVMVWIYGGSFYIGSSNEVDFFNNYLYVAKKVGCPQDDPTRMAKCLKVADPRALTLAYTIPWAKREYPAIYYLNTGPVVDGDFIPDDPLNLFANAADIDYLAGTNDMDGYFLAALDMPSIQDSNKNITDEDFYNLVTGFTMTKGLDGARAAFDIYTESWAQDSSQETKKKTVVDLETDILFLMPTEKALAQHRANARRARTYAYLFSVPSRNPDFPTWIGADHMEEIAYVFGKPFANPLGYRAQDRKVSKAMIAYWTNFARTGDPNNGFSAVPTHWYPYATDDCSYLDITKKMGSDSMKRHLRTKFYQFWTRTYEALPTVANAPTPVPPLDDSEDASVSPLAAPVSPLLDSEATPVSPLDDSEAAPVSPLNHSEAAPTSSAYESQLGTVYTGGFMEGVNKKLSLLGNDSVDIFKGIPFATAKTLENPQRHPGWQGTLKATDFKEACLQITLNPDSTYGDEDCLYLNIWVPQGSKQVSQDSPVMVWIYGGSFYIGSSNEVAKKVGCPQDDPTRMAKCLKVANPWALTLAYLYPWEKQEYFIPDDPLNLFANAADIDYLAGTNDMDGCFLAALDMPSIQDSNKNITDEDFYNLVAGFTMTKGLDGARAAFDIYTESWAQDSSQETKKKTVVNLEMDILFLMPTEKALAQHRANARRARTYAYLFSMPSRMPIYPKWMGADHADDLQYVFGKPFATPLGYRAQDRKVSKAMIAYWTNFARTGDPNNGFSAVPTHWYPYATDDCSYLDITKKMGSDSMKQHWRTKFFQFWTGTYEALPTVANAPTPVPPLDDSEAAPVPPADDSEAAPVLPADDSPAPQMPAAIGF
ncbi:bile salt-activated lipase [Octodon degus]|uniref:Bile salt-activated lipase n=1 Tax=Octodon degus TaxID=10160 RepID=A0A6P6D8P0_OCTDE|nr:bile salt-activated lipase [Octodon degus]